jgi:NADH-quinone oxidoreductase subunit H
LLPLAILFFISGLAETARIPFDFPESESELVSGYNTEYSSVNFVFFFLAEYLHILLIASLCVLFYGGSWFVPQVSLNDLGQTLVYFIKVACIVCSII